MFTKKIRKIINKKNKQKIICLTAYSKNIAKILDKHCDIVLVGDSLGTVLYNYDTTRKVSLKTMIEHSKSVKKGITKSLMVVDMPYRTYRNPKEALRNAKYIISQTGCDAVKIEGGKKIIKIIKHLVENKVQVMGHVGLLPQSEKGKFSFKGKTEIEKKRIFNDAKLLVSSGVFSIVLECTEKFLAKKITSSIKIPTIGIGASAYCDGQILVTDDLLGLNSVNYRFVKKYANLTKIIDKAARNFKQDVIKKLFPKKKNLY